MGDDFRKIAPLIFGITAWLAVTVIVVAILMARDSCSRRWSDIGETRHDMGCQVKIDGKWWPADAIKIDPR